MTNVVSFTLKDFIVPFGTVVSKYVISVADTNGVILSADAVDNSATFTDLPVGTWTPRAWAIDANGAQIGETATGADFVIDAPQTITIQIPDVVTIA